MEQEGNMMEQKVTVEIAGVKKEVLKGTRYETIVSEYQKAYDASGKPDSSQV